MFCYARNTANINMRDPKTRRLNKVAIFTATCVCKRGNFTYGKASSVDFGDCFVHQFLRRHLSAAVWIAWLVITFVDLTWTVAKISEDLIFVRI